MPSKLIPLLILILVLVVPAAFAATPAEKCEGKKLKASATYAACRLKVDGKAKLKDTTTDYTKCEAVLAKKFNKIEKKAAPGACPTENDRDQIASVIDDSTREVAEQLAGPDSSCPPDYWERTGTQVVLDLLQAYAAHDADAIACNYHPEAYVIDDQGVLVGQADIIAALFSLFDLFNGVSYTVLRIDEFNDTVRLLSRLDAGWVVIEDAVDTFVIQRGRIRKQGRHGLITFTGPPPD